MTRVKIAVVGNCQSRPIAKLLTRLNNNIEITTIAIVHLLKSEHEKDYIDSFQNADIIISQLVADNYPCKFVRTEDLKKKYGSKVLTILNLYYLGYNPDLFTFRVPSKGLLTGPTSTYHNKTILSSWKKGKSIEEAIRLYNDLDYNSITYGNMVDRTLEELKKREENIDIKITSFLEENLAKKRLFFTFNHPSLYLMLYLVRKIMQIKGIREESSILATNIKEPLGNIMTPVNVFSKKSLNISFSDPTHFNGLKFNGIKHNIFQYEGHCTYDIRSVVEEFYRLYDNSTDYIREFKIK